MGLLARLPLCAQRPFEHIHVNKKANRQTGSAVIVDSQGKTRRVASRAFQALPIENGSNALILIESSKEDASKAHLLFVNGETNKRRDLGPLPFTQATVKELSLPNGLPAYLLNGESETGPEFIVADLDAVHARISGSASSLSPSTITYRDAQSQVKSVPVEKLLGSDLRGIYKLDPTVSPKPAYIQCLRNGTLVLEQADGSFQSATWETDGESVKATFEDGHKLDWPRSALREVSGISASTRLLVRLTQPLESKRMKAGDSIETLLISPATENGKIFVPQNSIVSGTITNSHGVGFGIKHETAALTVEFNRIKFPNGDVTGTHAKLYQVDNAQEKVTEAGKIQGIRSTGTLGYSAEGKIASVANFDPLGYLFSTAAATAALGFAEPEILYPAGTELLIELQAPVILNTTFESKIPEIAGTHEEQNHLAQFVRNLPFRTKTQGSNKDSDITNLVFIGPESGLRNAFKAAGWEPADQLTAGTTFRTMKTLAGNQTYRQAPMSMLMLDERPPLFTLTKTTNTFSSRHHLRVFDPHARFNSISAYTASSTQDIGIGFSKAHKTFIHLIDQYIDNERTKIVNDLEFTGCVSGIELVPRPWVPLDAFNSTGDPLRTDGAVAILKITDCANPRTTPTTNAIPPNRTERIFRDATLTLRNDIVRGNLVYQSVSGIIQARRYFAHRNDLKTDSGAWEKADLSGVKFTGVSGAPDRRVSTTKSGSTEFAYTPPEPPAPDHRWDPPRYEIALHGGYMRYPHTFTSGLSALFVDDQSHLPDGAALLADAISGGWTAGISLTLNTWRWVSNEFAYHYQHGRYEYDTIGINSPLTEGLQSNPSGMSVRQTEYNVLVHARPREARLRPYVAAGPVLQLLSLNDATLKKPSKVFTLGLKNIGILKSAFDFGNTPPLEGGGIFQLGLQYGGGIKYRVHPRVMLQADFRETWSKNPEFLRQSYTEEFFQTVGYAVDYQHVPSSGFFRQQRSTIGIAFTF